MDLKHLRQGEYIIWMDRPFSYYRRIWLIVLGIIAGVAILSLASLPTTPSAALGPIILGSIIIISSVIAYILNMRGDEYVVTNIRAMHVKNGKVRRQVYLFTPGLFVSIANQRYYYSSESEEYVVSNVVEDVVFLLNGVEALRFYETSKGDELIAKLRSMGFHN